MAGAGDAVPYRSNAGWAFTDAFTSLWLILPDAAFSAGFFAAHLPWPVAGLARQKRAGRRDRPVTLSFQLLSVGPVSPGRL